MKYLIELVADTKGLEPGVDMLEEIGKADKANAEQFKKTNQEFKKYESSLNGVSKGMKEVSKAATGAFGGEAIKDATKKAESFRTQLRQSRDELVKMFQSGEVSTAQIYKLAKAGGNLKDQMGDAQQAINVLASDTFRLDAALQGIQTGAAAFQIIQGAAALAGDENKDLQKTLVKLNAVMAITQGLQQIQNALQKQTALSLGLNIAAQKAYTFVVGESAGALKVFRLALAATGIGAVLLAVIALISNWDKLKQSGGLLTKTLEGIGKATGAVVQGFKDLFDALGLSDFAIKESNDRLEQNLMIGLEKMQRAHKLKIDIMKAQNKETLKTELQFAQEELKQLRKLAQWDDSKTEEGKKRLENERELTDKIIILKEEIKQKEIEDAKKLAEERLKREKELLQQEIQLQEINLLELTNNARERLKIEENLIFLKGELQKKDAKSLVERQLIETKVITDIEELRKKFRENELKQIALRKQKTLDAEAKILEAELKREEKRRDAHRQRMKDLDEFRDAEDEYDKKWKDEQEDKRKTYVEAAAQVEREIADTIFSIAASNRNAIFNAEIQQLNDRKNRELSNKELTEAQKTRIELRYQREIAAVKTRQAQADKQAAIAQAIVNGALAITRILALQGGSLDPAAIANIIVTTAATAAQVAVIASQKIPKFAKGTEYVNGGGTETSDSIPAMLSKGERVVDAKTNKMLKGIPNSMLPLLVPDLMIPKQTIISQGMDYDKLAKSLSKELSKNPQLLVNFDKRGFETFVRNGNSEQQIKNNRNGF